MHSLQQRIQKFQGEMRNYTLDILSLATCGISKSNRFINMKIKKETWIGDLEIWYEIIQGKVCGVRKEDFGQNSKKLQWQRDKDTPYKGLYRQSRKKTRRASWKPRNMSITQRRYQETKHRKD